MHFTFNVEIDVERLEGKFASRDEISSLLYDAIEGAINDADMSGLGSDGNSEYEITDSNVEEIEQPKPVKVKKPKAVTSTAVIPVE